MNMTFKELLDVLEEPENADQIKHLANFKNLKYVENVKNIGGLPGLLSRFILRITQKNIDAVLALAECETAEDIARFKTTDHYEKIKNTKISADDLGKLSNLSKLKKLEKLK